MKAETRAKFHPLWIVVWAISSLWLLALLLLGVSPLAWASAFLVLFLIPELVGLRKRGDSLPPLTYVIRRYIPRWIPTAVTWGVAAWMIGSWWEKADHPLLMSILVAGMAGWLTNHWDVTYDGPGE